MDQQESQKKERRSGVDRRSYDYTNHVPERRKSGERREQQNDTDKA